MSAQNERWPGQIDPEADRAMREFSGYLRRLESFRVDVDSTVRSTIGGMDVGRHLDSAYTLEVERPNKLALVLQRGSVGTTIICDGQTIWRYWPGMKRYTEGPAPKTLDGVATALGAGDGLEFGIPECIDFVLRDDPYAAMTAGASRIASSGVENIDGVTCCRLTLDSPTRDWQLWIGPDKVPLLRRFVPDLSKKAAQVAALNPDIKDMVINVAVTLQNWQVNIGVAHDKFRFAPPEGVVKKDLSKLRKEGLVCEKCGRPADVHVVETVAGRPEDTSSHDFCRQCSDREG